MKKINWFARLFMSWNALETYFLNQNNNSDEELRKIHQLDIDLARSVEQSNSLREQILNLKSWQNDNERERANISNERDHLKNELQKFTNKNENLSIDNSEKANKISEYLEKIDNLKATITKDKAEFEDIKRNISQKLEPLTRIQKTFFAESGNKGKGEFGERQLKNILEKSGLVENDFWVENLRVGNEQVEFAIKADENQKWIPVDSKVLDTEIDEDNKIIIDDKFVTRLKTQVKSVAKYLGKTNTADYGLLVLQNDNIYIELYNKDPNLFEEVIREHKIYICSPSSFVQFSWSISHLLDIYKRVHHDEKIYDEMVDVLTTISKLTNSLAATHKHFNVAMETHYPTLQKRQAGLIKKLDKGGKIKALPNLSNDSGKEDIDETE